MVLIYQPPNAHERILWILLRKAMAAAAAVKKINRAKFKANLSIVPSYWHILSSTN
jgi:hypothetical protein